MNIDSYEMMFLGVGVLTTTNIIQGGVMSAELLGNAAGWYLVFWLLYDPIWKSGRLPEALAREYDWAEPLAPGVSDER